MRDTTPAPSSYSGHVSATHVGSPPKHQSVVPDVGNVVSRSNATRRGFGVFGNKEERGWILRCIVIPQESLLLSPPKKKPSQGYHHAPYLRQARERPQGMSVLRKPHPSSHKNSAQRSSSPSAHPNLSSKPLTTSSKFSNRKHPPSKDNASNSDLYLENDSSRLPSTSSSLSSPSLLISVSLSTARLMPNPVFLFSSLLLRPPISVPSRGY